MIAEWGKITAREILPPINGKLISGNEGSVITGISTDTREIERGQLFIAIRGERFDGHDFAGKALEKGASCIIAERVRRLGIPSNSDTAVIEVLDTVKALGDLANWWRRQQEVVVAAITGSTGKTTVKEMTATILGLGSRTLKSKGNFNNLIGLPLTLLGLRRGDRRAVLEMGMNRPGEIGRLTEISEPDIGLITNVARAHLEGLGDIRGVARAKTELLEKISPGSTALLYGDDELLMEEASRFEREITTFGLGPGNDIRAGNIKNLGYGGTSFEIEYKGTSIPIGIGVPGMHNLLNALAAASIAICMKEPPDHIREGLNRFEGINGRLRPVYLYDDVILVDDTYNSNPHSLKAALDTLRDLAGGRRLIVGLGDMMELGDETVSAHREAGAMVAELGVSYFITMGDHAPDMIAGAVDRGFPPEKTGRAVSHSEMAQRIMDVIKEGDLILLKGSRKMGLDKVSRDLKEEWSEEDQNGKKNNGGG